MSCTIKKHARAQPWLCCLSSGSARLLKKGAFFMLHFTERKTANSSPPKKSKATNSNAGPEGANSSDKKYRKEYAKT